MGKMIRADLRRICRRPGFYVLMIFLMLMQLKDILSIDDEPVDEILANAKTKLSLTYLLFITVFLFLWIIADDKKSNAWVYNIGIGMDRVKLLLAKIIDFVVLHAIYYIVIVSLRIFLYLLMDVPISSRQISFLILFAAFQLFYGVSVMIISLLADLVTGSIAIGILVDVGIVFLMDMGLTLLETFWKINLGDYFIKGLLENAVTNISVGRFPWQLIPVVGIYIVGVFLAASQVFKNKELDL